MSSSHRVLETLVLLVALGAIAALVGLVAFGVTGVVIGAALAWLLAGATAYVPPQLVVRLRGGIPLPFWRAPQLHAMVQRIAARVSMHPPRLYWIPEPAANALAAGGGRHPGALALTFGALQILDPDELEGVVAHEIAHLRNRDAALLRLAGGVTRATAWMVMIAAWIALAAAAADGAPTLPALGLAALALVVPIGMSMLHAHLSRTRELAADDTAVSLTGNPRALASALLKLERQSAWWQRWLAQPRPDVPPSLRSHPDTAYRVRRLMRLA